MALDTSDKQLFEEYLFEKITAAHYSLLQELYNDAFHVTISIEEIAKKFGTEKLGLDVIGYIALHLPMRNPAAFYGVFPLKAIINNSIIQIAQSGDTMTHSQHRNKGLFVKLAKRTFNECQQKGIKIVIGQPNDASYHGFVNKLGWKHLDNIIRWDLKLKIKTAPLSRIAHNLQFIRKFYLLYASFILRKYLVKHISSFHNEYSGNYAKIYRDGNYIDFKKANNKFFICVDGVLLWISLVDLFWIGDMQNQENITPDFLKKLKRISFLLGCNTISLNSPASIPLPNALASFKKNSTQASCFFYIDPAYEGLNFVLTAADSDTW